MILNKQSETLKIDNKLFGIGDYCVANIVSEFKGRIGTILEIRTDDDMDTDNIGPDIYVDFGDGEVIMAADMLEELPF